MTDLATLNKAVQADKGANKSVKAWIDAATPLIQSAPPPAERPWYIYDNTSPLTSSLPQVWAQLPGIGCFVDAQDSATLQLLKSKGYPAFAQLGATDASGKPTLTDAQAVSIALADVASAGPYAAQITFMLADEPGLVNGNPTSASAWIAQRVKAMRAAGITQRLAITYYDSATISAFAAVSDPAQTNRFTIIGDLYPGQTNNLNWRTSPKPWQAYVTELMAATVGMGFDCGYVLGDFGDPGYTLPTPAQLASFITTAEAGDGKGHKADVLGVYGWGYGSVPSWIYAQIAAAMA